MDIFVARQPILDSQERLIAYELLFRAGPENLFTAQDGDAASSSVIGNSLGVFGLDALIGDKRAFINFTRSLLVGEVFTVLPRDRVVIELLETIEPEPAVLEACRRAKALGFQLALDDFVYHERFAPLLALADIVKVDFQLSTPDERRAMAARLRPQGIRMLAEKVETRAEMSEAVASGYELFQGYFFCKPEVVRTTDIPALKLNQLALLRVLSAPDLDVERAAAAVKQDVSFSVKLLRYLNSAAFGLRNQVTSIRQATALLGERAFRRWASLVTVSTMSQDRPAALMMTCIVRAKLCELVGELLGLRSRDDLFLVGMLSAMDAILGRPIAEILPKLGLGVDLQEAILRCADLDAALTSFERPSPGRAGELAPVLGLVLLIERARWHDVDRLGDRLGLPPAALAGGYRRAVSWSESLVGAV